MTNIKLISNALDLMVDFNVANSYYLGLTIQEMIERLKEWYNNTEIVDARMLAAVAIEGKYEPTKDWNYCLDRMNFYFPDDSLYNNFSIEEIEEAIFDSTF